MGMTTLKKWLLEAMIRVRLKISQYTLTAATLTKSIVNFLPAQTICISRQLYFAYI